MAIGGGSGRSAAALVKPRDLAFWYDTFITVDAAPNQTCRIQTLVYPDPPTWGKDQPLTPAPRLYILLCCHGDLQMDPDVLFCPDLVPRNSVDAGRNWYILLAVMYLGVSWPEPLLVPANFPALIRR